MVENEFVNVGAPENAHQMSNDETLAQKGGTHVGKPQSAHQNSNGETLTQKGGAHVGEPQSARQNLNDKTLTQKGGANVGKPQSAPQNSFELEFTQFSGAPDWFPPATLAPILLAVATTDNVSAAADTCYRQYFAADTSDHAAIAIAAYAAAKAGIFAARDNVYDAGTAAQLALDATATSPVTGTLRPMPIQLSKPPLLPLTL